MFSVLESGKQQSTYLGLHFVRATSTRTKLSCETVPVSEVKWEEKNRL